MSTKNDQIQYVHPIYGYPITEKEADRIAMTHGQMMFKETLTLKQVKEVQNYLTKKYNLPDSTD